MPIKVPKPDPTPESLVFAKKILAERERLGMSQREFAKAAELSQAYIVNLELGRANVTINTASQLAKLVNRPLWKLLKD